MSWKAAPIALVLTVSLIVLPALAFDTSKLGQGGSLPLSDLMPLIGKSAKLQREVDSALADAKKKADDLMCEGVRFPGSWDNLGGERVAPYTCEFSGKWLQINTTVRVTDKNGRAFETVTPAAMKNATKVTETNPTWKWTTTDPNNDN
jgi:hypothetical protein